MKERRLGLITIHNRLLRDAIDSGDGANLFIGAVPLDVQRDFISDTTTFLLWHPRFRVLPLGEITPRYEAVFDKDSVIPRWVECST
jgi:hypothetical protein